MKSSILTYAIYFLLFVLYSALVVYIIPTGEISHEIPYWVRWTTHMQQYGFTNAYELAENNYNPLYQYFLLLYIKLVGNASVAKYIHGLKMLTLLFDFAGALLAASLVPGRRQFLLAFLLLLNAGYISNTLVWGQVDAIYTCLVFAALVLSLREQPVSSLLFYVLALNAKLQALLFLPVLILLWLPQWIRAPKSLPLALVAALGLQALLLLPFLLAHGFGYVTHIRDNTFGSIDDFPMVSLYCFNGWHLLLGNERNLAELPDSLRVAGLTYYQWGLLAFLLFSIVLLVPLLRLSVRSILARRQLRMADYGLVFLCSGLIPVLLCFFNTQMHSRYMHASILLFGAYAFITRRYFLFGLTSVAYFLNLTALVNVFAYYKLTLAWNPQFNARFVASLYLLVIIQGIREVYRPYQLKQYLRMMYREWLLWERPRARTAADKKPTPPARLA